MNPRLALLHPYPFERMRQLSQGLKPSPGYREISLAIGEPQHAAPERVKAALAQAMDGLSRYPSTLGDAALRQAAAHWLHRRYGIDACPDTQVLPVNGSREALFAFAQVVIDATRPDPTVVCPNPFYQIYEGAALLAGARPWYAPCEDARDGAVDWGRVPEEVWRNTQLVFACSPGNPSGAVMTLSDWQLLFELSDRYGFIIASDECYSEIWLDEPPLGALQAATALGRKDFKNLVMFTSLSKRSNVPGLRSGFVAGDRQCLAAFLQYRTYHGSAMSPVVQAASIAAWNDEQHVQENRALYQRKFQSVLPVLQEVLPVKMPQAGFYLWTRVPQADDIDFSLRLWTQYNVRILPGSLLSRDGPGGHPGAGRIRLALVASEQDCLEAAHRMVRFVHENTASQS